MERRAFLALSAAAGAAARAAPRLPLKAPPPWYATMRRCGQLNFNERDPLTLDVAAWIDYLASLRVNALLVNGGCHQDIDQSAVPDHQSSWFMRTCALY